MSEFERIQILVVDDNTEFSEILKEIIEDSTSYLAVCCKSADEAFKYLDKNHQLVAGIISDVMMAGVDGIEFLGKLRATEIWKDIPLIFLSGSDPKVFENLLAPFGFTSFLSKPVHANVLIQAIKDRFQKFANSNIKSA